MRNKTHEMYIDREEILGYLRSQVPYWSLRSVWMKSSRL